MQHLNLQAYHGVLQSGPPPLHRFPAQAIAADNLGQWSAWREPWRSQLEELLGLPLIRESGTRCPLEVRSTGVEQFPTYTREKLFISTEPALEIPCYLLLPLNAAGPVPVVITPHGHGSFGKETYVGNYHSEEERRHGQEGERDIALQAVAQGYAALAPDVRAFNEMSLQEDFQRSSHSCTALQNKALMYGRTLIGERVHDMGRLIDFAATRPELDSGRIVITGNSGGGTVSLFTAALDERITVAVPASYFCSFHHSIVEIWHCPCNVVPGILRYGEMSDVAGLIAPRPVLFVNGKQDPIFPIAATRQAFEDVQTIYAVAGSAENCELYEGEGGHRYYKARVWDFVREHLGRATPATPTR